MNVCQSNSFSDTYQIYYTNGQNPANFDNSYRPYGSSTTRNTSNDHEPDHRRSNESILCFSPTCRHSPSPRYYRPKILYDTNIPTYQILYECIYIPNPSNNHFSQPRLPSVFNAHYSPCFAIHQLYLPIIVLPTSDAFGSTRVQYPILVP